MQDRIIEFLKDSDGYISGEEISEILKISRAAVWKYIQELREEGYDIVAIPHLGYKFVSAPDKLFPSEIQFQLGTKILGKRVEYFDTISSTMDAAFDLGMQNAQEGTIVVAEGQAKGRGRLGRSWVSPKGKGIYMSAILRPACTLNETARLTLLSAVAICDAVKNVTGLLAQIKWPNDILIDGKKLAGILTELSAETDRVKFVVVGIGLNVNTRKDALPDGATSLRAQKNEAVSRVKITQEILKELELGYLALQKQGFALTLKRWKDLNITLGHRVKIVDPAGQIEGVAIDLDHDGGLMIRKDNGVVIKRLAGDVVQLR